MIHHFRMQEVSLRLLHQLGTEKFLKEMRQMSNIPDDAWLTETPFKYVDTGEEFLRKAYCQPNEAEHLELCWNWSTEEEQQ